ncbi:MAG: hypothetical protein IJM92_14360 [Fibrobacter sp.]|nr:hypothetical protein [Fibrobacter sp.]MBQ7080804.1 hypothetical protein [Fibrobacter sp.]
MDVELIFGKMMSPHIINNFFKLVLKKDTFCKRKFSLKKLVVEKRLE